MSFRHYLRKIKRAGFSRYLHVQVLALGAGGVLAVGVIVIGLQLSHSGFHERVDYTTNLFKHTRPMLSLLADQRVAESNYISASSEKYLLQREKIAREVRKVISTLHADIHPADEEVRNLLKRVESANARRDTAFQGLIKLKREIGSAGTTGLKAAFSSALAKLNERFEAAGEGALGELAENVQSQARFYLADGELVQFLRFTQNRVKLEELLETAEFQNPRFEQLKASLKSFTSSFGALVWAHDRVKSQSELLTRGFEEQQRVLNQFSTALEVITAEAERNSQASLSLALELISLTILASLILAVMVSHWVRTTISAPLRDMAVGMERLATGHLDVTISPHDRFDELGTLSRAFFMFQQRLREVVDLSKQLEAQREELLKKQVVLDLVMSTSPVGLAVFNRNDEIISMNDRYSSVLFGKPDAVPLGLRVDQIWQRLVELGLLDSLPEHRDRDQGLVSMVLFKFRDGRSCRVLRQSAADGSWVATTEDVTDRVRMDDHIAHLALHDSLTDLPNRAFFTNHLDACLRREGHGPIAVFFLDLDRFKEVNDTFGHAAGDSLLESVAGRLRATLKNGEFIARLGGDEFAIFIEGLKSEEELSLAGQRIIDVVSAPYYLAGATHVIGCSMGIAVAPRDGENASDLLVRADLALYRSKHQGRGIYHFYAPDMAEQHERVLVQERELREALVHGQFEVWYQPIYSLDGLRIMACEALLRWRHPVRGLVSPVEFIPVAERSGLISPIGGWVLKKVCADAVKWPADLKVCVNVSVVQLRSAHLKSVVRSAPRVFGTACAPSRSRDHREPHVVWQ